MAATGSAATINKLMRYFLCFAVFLLLISLFLVQNTATSAAVPGQSSKAQGPAVPRSMQLTATAITEEYCRNTATQEAQLFLALKLSVKNSSEKTLIVSRFANAINRVVLSKSLKKAKSEDYVYDERTTFMRVPLLRQIDIQQVSPTLEFVTLKPSESFDYEYPPSTDITLTESSGRTQRFSPGSYFMQVKIRTWQWDSEKIRPLEQLWAQYGSLWYKDITSEPFAISIEKPASTLTACKLP